MGEFETWKKDSNGRWVVKDQVAIHVSNPSIEAAPVLGPTRR